MQLLHELRLPRLLLVPYLLECLAGGRRLDATESGNYQWHTDGRSVKQQYQIVLLVCLPNVCFIVLLCLVTSRGGVWAAGRQLTTDQTRCAA